MATKTKTAAPVIEAPKSKFADLLAQDESLTASAKQVPFIQQIASQGKVFLSDENAVKAGFFPSEGCAWERGEMVFRKEGTDGTVTKTTETGYVTDRLRCFILGSSTYEAKDSKGSPIVKFTKAGKPYNQLDTKVYLVLVDDSNNPLCETYVVLTLKGGSVFGSTFSEAWNQYKKNDQAWLLQVWNQFTRMTGNRGGNQLFQSGFVFEATTATKTLQKSDCCFVVGTTPITDTNVEDESMCGLGHKDRTKVVSLFEEVQAALETYRKPKPVEADEEDGDY
jgi:hypothetical protein